MIEDHYWDNGIGVFSSKRQQLVDYGDAEYQTWLAAGGLLSKHPGDALLRGVLAPYGIGLTPTETTKLQAFQKLVERPHLLARAMRRLLLRLIATGTLTQAQAASVLQVTEQDVE